MNSIAGVESLTNLCDVDLAQNELPAVPEALYKLEALKRLNLADNEIRQLDNAGVESWAKLETLNVSRNQLKVLPQVGSDSRGLFRHIHRPILITSTERLSGLSICVSGVIMQLSKDQLAAAAVSSRLLLLPVAALVRIWFLS